MVVDDYLALHSDESTERTDILLSEEEDRARLSRSLQDARLLCLCTDASVFNCLCDLLRCRVYTGVWSTATGFAKHIFSLGTGTGSPPPPSLTQGPQVFLIMWVSPRLATLLWTAFCSFCILASSSARCCSLFLLCFMHTTTTAATMTRSGTAVDSVAITTTCSVVSPESPWVCWETCFEMFPILASSSSSHTLPFHPSTQLHLYPFTLLTQAPPLRHGLEAHSSTSMLQSFPVNPGRQVQR